MYLDFYRLEKPPFHITPDPEFLFLSPSHKAALGAIIHGIEERYGFVTIVGEVGVGKTTVIRAYLERADRQQFKTIYIANSEVSFHTLLKSVLRELGVDYDTAEEPFNMVNRLHQVLLEEYEQGHKVALIFDEAQDMPVETLEHLRILSNLETPTEKLLQIVFVGQPELKHKLGFKELRYLKQRVVLGVTIEPLTDRQSLAYIHHRLAKVATVLEPIFTPSALKLIVAAAKGTPRILCILGTNALIAGYGYRQNPITAKTVREVINHLEDSRKHQRLRHGLAWPLAFLVFVGVIGLSGEKIQYVSNATVTYLLKPQKMFSELRSNIFGTRLYESRVKKNHVDNHMCIGLVDTVKQIRVGIKEKIDGNIDFFHEKIQDTEQQGNHDKNPNIKNFKTNQNSADDRSQHFLGVHHFW
jgi:general secretion pathway protein A